MNLRLFVITLIIPYLFRVLMAPLIVHSWRSFLKLSRELMDSGEPKSSMEAMLWWLSWRVKTLADELWSVISS